MRYLAAAEESDERQVAERIAHLLELGAATAEHVLAASDAREIQPAARARRQRSLQLAQDPVQVAAGACRIALAKQYLVVALDVIADRDQFLARIDRDQVAHQIVAARAPIGLP